MVRPGKCGPSWRNNHEVGMEYAAGVRTAKYHPWAPGFDSSTGRTICTATTSLVTVLLAWYLSR